MKRRLLLCAALYAALAAANTLKWRTFLLNVETYHQYGLLFTSDDLADGPHTLSATLLAHDGRKLERSATVEADKRRAILPLDPAEASAIGEGQIHVVRTGVDGETVEGGCCVR